MRWSRVAGIIHTMQERERERGSCFSTVEDTCDPNFQYAWELGDWVAPRCVDPLLAAVTSPELTVAPRRQHLAPLA